MSLRVVDLEDGSIVSTINWPLPRAWPERHQPSGHIGYWQDATVSPFAAFKGLPSAIFVPSLVHGGHCCGWRSLGSGLPLGTLIVSLRSCWVLGGYWQEVRQETDGPRLSLPHQARETLILDRGYSSPDLTIFSLMPLKIKFTYCILKLSLRQENKIGRAHV